MSEKIRSVEFALQALLIGAVTGLVLFLAAGCSTVPTPTASYEDGYAQVGLVFCSAGPAVETEPAQGGGGWWSKTQAHILRNGGKYGILGGMAAILGADALEGNGIDGFGSFGEEDDPPPPPNKDYVKGSVSATGAGSSVEISKIYSLQQLDGLDISASDGGRVKISHSGGN